MKYSYIHATIGMNSENMRNEKKPNIEGHILCDSVYMKFPEQANP